MRSLIDAILSNDLLEAKRILDERLDELADDALTDVKDDMALEMFGVDYWKMFKTKMSHHISQLDHQFIQTVDSNIEWWTRDKKIQNIIT